MDLSIELKNAYEEYRGKVERIYFAYARKRGISEAKKELVAEANKIKREAEKVDFARIMSDFSKETRGRKKKSKEVV